MTWPESTTEHSLEHVAGDAWVLAQPTHRVRVPHGPERYRDTQSVTLADDRLHRYTFETTGTRVLFEEPQT